MLLCNRCKNKNLKYLTIEQFCIPLSISNSKLFTKLEQKIKEQQIAVLSYL